MPRFDTGITWASIHPGTKEIKEKNNLCKALIQVSHGHPSIHPSITSAPTHPLTKESKKEQFYAKV
jgi:hypothetical protein